MDPEEEPDNHNLPIANVSRIMKDVIGTDTKIAKEAKETVQECVSEFISFITCEASEKCKTEKRKTINGDDIIYALETLGFDDYTDILKKYLLKYRAAWENLEKHQQSKLEHHLESGNVKNNDQMKVMKEES